jgi:polar amino acid transport system substrate-binding protein
MKKFLLIILFTITLQSNDHFTIVKIEDTILTETSFSILKEAYSKLNIKIKTKLLPGQRALIATDYGHYDAELIRIKGIDKKYKNLIRIDVPIMNVQGVIFSKDIDIKTNSWDDLKPYKLGFLRGIVLATENTQGFDRKLLSTNEQLYQMLDIGRLDMVFSGFLTGSYYVSKLGIKNVKVLNPPLVQTDVYHYVHKKHKTIVPKLYKILFKMKQSGRIDEIKKEMLYKYGITN